MDSKVFKLLFMVVTFVLYGIGMLGECLCEYSRLPFNRLFDSGTWQSLTNDFVFVQPSQLFNPHGYDSFNRDMQKPPKSSNLNARFTVLDSSTSVNDRGHSRTSRVSNLQVHLKPVERQSLTNTTLPRPDLKLRGKNVTRRSSSTDSNTKPPSGRRDSSLFGDRSTRRWEWPLTVQPKVTNEETLFEVEFNVWPYTNADTRVRITGTELFIHIIPLEQTQANRFNLLKPMFRTYQLPINIDSKKIRFRFINEYTFTVTAGKVPVQSFNNDYTKSYIVPS